MFTIIDGITRWNKDYIKRIDNVVENCIYHVFNTDNTISVLQITRDSCNKQNFTESLLLKCKIHSPIVAHDADSNKIGCGNCEQNYVPSYDTNNIQVFNDVNILIYDGYYLALCSDCIMETQKYEIHNNIITTIVSKLDGFVKYYIYNPICNYHHYVSEYIINCQHFPDKGKTHDPSAQYICDHCNNVYKSMYDNKLCNNCRSQVNTLYFANKYAIHWIIIDDLDLINDLKLKIKNIFTLLFDVLS